MSMDSMMAGVMGLAWLPMLLGLALLIGGTAAIFRLLSPAQPRVEDGRTKLVLATLVLVAGVLLVGALAMMPMHR